MICIHRLVATIRNNGFEGWYFKHQNLGKTIAFIPGRAKSGSFIQMLDDSGSRQFEVKSFRVSRGVIHAGDCLFSNHGIVIDLPGVNGQVTYGPLSPLKSNIMGPFQFLPMECRHGVISMRHSLYGSLTVDGNEYKFDGGLGYMEKDSGTSFPRSYLWLQCNDFSDICSIMVSIANIPFSGISFTGCICAIIFNGKEYRLATYNGVRIHSNGPDHICLSQNKLLLELDVLATDNGHPLRSPVRGQMSSIIRETINASIRARLWDNGDSVFDIRSHNAAFEYVK